MKHTDKTFFYTDRTWLTTDLNQEKEEVLEFDISDLKSKGPLSLYVFNGYIKIHEVYLQENIETRNDNIYLYNQSNNWQDVSGKWNQKTVQYNPKFSQENGYLYIDSSESGSAGYFQTENQIDFSKYSKLGIKWSRCKTRDAAHFTVEAGIWKGITDAVSKCDTQTLEYTNRTWLTTDLNQEEGEWLEFDITNLQSKGSVYLYVYDGYIKIYEVYLKK